MEASRGRPPSRARLLAEARRKLEKCGHCLLPAVRHKIIHLRESNTAEDDERRVVIHLDLISAINSGIATDVSIGSPPCLTIVAIDCEGRRLLVVVEIPPGEDDALLITDFTLLLD